MKKGLGISELHNKLISGEINAKELYANSIRLIETNKKLNAFVTVLDDFKENNSNSIINNIPCAIKDNFSTKGILSTGSSNTLKDYIPIYDATVIKKLKESGALIIGKTVMDELGMGGSGITGHTGVTLNPYDNTRICGGSSCGSVCAVASGIVPYALGSDTGDSIRKPSAYTGCVGYKPTYGLISRFGLFPFASSLDHVGVIARSVEDCAIVTDIIKGKDSHDMTTYDSSNINLFDNLNKEVKGKKLFYIKELLNIDNYIEKTPELIKIIDNFNEVIEKSKALGIETIGVSIDLKLLSSIYPTYETISCAEATSNYSNLTGLIFGPRSDGNTIEDVMKNHRTEGFSPLIKRRFIIGSYVLQRENQEKYYLNACRARRLITDKMNDLFKEYDGLIMPCSGRIAPRFTELSNKDNDLNKILENHLAIGNFGGYPSITIPSGIIDNMPIGINITGMVKDDINVLNIASNIENTLGYKDMIVGEENGI